MMTEHTGLFHSIRRSLELPDVLLLAAVGLLPWALGGVEVWAYRLAAFLIVAGCTVLILRNGPKALGLRWRDPFVTIPLLLFFWALLQLTPLPPQVIRGLSPAADRIYQDTFPSYTSNDSDPADLRETIERQGLELYPEAIDLPIPTHVTESFEPTPGGNWTGWRTLSLLPAAGRERLLWFTALWLAFVAIRRRSRSRERRRAYRDILFSSFLLQMAFGLVYAATGNGRLYWIRETVEQTQPFGTYVNPTNFAGVMELAIPWMTGCLMAAFYRRGRGAWAEARTMMLAGGIILGLLATVASATRSSSVMIPVAVLAIVVVSARGWRSRGTILLIGLLVFAVSVPLVQKTHLGERVTEMLQLGGGEVQSVGRSVTAPAALAMLGDYWRGGCGIGAFRDVFPNYMPAGETARYNQLHNDYLEVAIEGGLPLILLVLGLIVVFWKRLLHPTALRSPRGLRRQQLGLVTGLILLSLHALWDFNHQIPANALLFVALAALALGRIEHSRRRQASPTRGGFNAVSVFAIGSALFFALLAVQGWIGSRHYSKGRQLSAQGIYDEALPHVDQGGIGHRHSASLWLAGQVRLGLWHEGYADGVNPTELRPLLDQAYHDYTSAIAASPASGWYWASLGDLYYQLERTDRLIRPFELDLLDIDPRSRVGRWGRVAIGLTRKGIRREPNVYTFHDQLAFMFWDFKVLDDARAAARQSAEVLPLYRIHAYDLLAPAPDELLTAFAEGIERSVGNTPFIHDVRRQISRGIVAMKLRDFEQAEQQLRQATAGNTSLLLAADAHFQHGRALLALERYDEAAEAFHSADGHPNFDHLAPYWEGQARERSANWEAALAAYGRARRADRKDLRAALGYARAARELRQYQQAETTLELATRNHPQNPKPWHKLLEVRLDVGNSSGAQAALERLVALGLTEEARLVLERKIDAVETRH